MKTYTLKQFINNIEIRKNMKRNDKVIIAFNELKQTKKTMYKNVFNYVVNNKNYDLYIISNIDNNNFIVSVIVNNVEFEIGTIIDKTNEPLTYIVNVDCDIYFY